MDNRKLPGPPDWFVRLCLEVGIETPQQMADLWVEVQREIAENYAAAIRRPRDER